ncbi:MAG: sigma-70 family RNA polymerase sigma factor [Lachnospiraceae bacterium]|nr:sigma-70 family RNA polymerase sigma factor [Lachnospiraceae bacterium]
MMKQIRENEADDMERLSFLYKKYRFLLFKVANEILKDRFLAEDAIHNTFEKISHQMDRIDDPDSQKTMRFLVVVTKNTAIDMWRKRKNRNEHETGMDSLNEKENPVMGINSDVDNRVIEAFYKLPDKYRDVFFLKYSSGYDNKAVSEILEISEAAVRQRLLRGKKLLKKELDEKEKKDGKDKGH